MDIFASGERTNSFRTDFEKEIGDFLRKTKPLDLRILGKKLQQLSPLVWLCQLKRFADGVSRG